MPTDTNQAELSSRPSEEAIRTAIAEACGHERIVVDYESLHPEEGYTKGPDGHWRTPSANKWLKQLEAQDVRCVGNYFVHLETEQIYADFDGPDNGVNGRGTFDYLHDLNACHEMEETLTPLEEDRYADELEGITVARAWNATAEDRCEAFLRVKGLWEGLK